MSYTDAELNAMPSSDEKQNRIDELEGVILRMTADAKAGTTLHLEAIARALKAENENAALRAQLEARDKAIAENDTAYAREMASLSARLKAERERVGELEKATDAFFDHWRVYPADYGTLDKLWKARQVALRSRPSPQAAPEPKGCLPCGHPMREVVLRVCDTCEQVSASKPQATTGKECPRCLVGRPYEHTCQQALTQEPRKEDGNG